MCLLGVAWRWPPHLASPHTRPWSRQRVLWGHRSLWQEVDSFWRKPGKEAFEKGTLSLLKKNTLCPYNRSSNQNWDNLLQEITAWIFEVARFCLTNLTSIIKRDCNLFPEAMTNCDWNLRQDCFISTVDKKSFLQDGRVQKRQKVEWPDHVRHTRRSSDCERGPGAVYGQMYIPTPPTKPLLDDKKDADDQLPKKIVKAPPPGPLSSLSVFLVGFQRDHEVSQSIVFHK